MNEIILVIYSVFIGVGAFGTIGVDIMFTEAIWGHIALLWVLDKFTNIHPAICIVLSVVIPVVIMLILTIFVILRAIVSLVFTVGWTWLIVWIMYDCGADLTWRIVVGCVVALIIGGLHLHSVMELWDVDVPIKAKTNSYVVMNEDDFKTMHNKATANTANDYVYGNAYYNGQKMAHQVGGTPNSNFYGSNYQAFEELKKAKEKEEQYKELLRQQKETYTKIIREQQSKNNGPDYEELFANCTDKASLNKRYRELIKIFHPDNANGSNEQTIRIKETYQNLLHNMT